MQPQREHRWGRLGREVFARRAVQRIVALGRREPGGVGERRQVRENREKVAHRGALARIARPGEQPVVLVEPVGVGLEREPEQREIGLAGGRALAPVHHQRQVHRLPIDVVSPHPVRAADLEPERGRRGRDARLGVVHEPQRVDHGRVGVGDGREGSDGGAARGDVGQGEIVVLVEAVGEREPRAARVPVVIRPFPQHLPLERTGALAGAIQGLPGGARTAGDGAQPAGVLVGGRARRDGPAAIHAEATHRERVGLRESIERQDVHGGVPGQGRGVDHEEEPARLVVQVPRLAVQGLARDLADRVEPVFHHVALLLGEDAPQLDGPDLRDRLDAEVVGGNGGADEAGRRRLEGDVARLDPPQDFARQPFVPHLEIVVGVELPLAVEVDVDVEPLAYDAGGTDRVLWIGSDRGKAGVAAREGELLLGHRAAQVAELVGLELEADVELHAQVGVLAEEPRRMERRGWGCGRITRTGILRGGLGYDERQGEKTRQHPL